MTDEVLKFARNLPVHPGVQGREKYFNAAVLIPIVRMDGGYKLLFQKRAPNIRQEGEICFPGGGIEEDKDADVLETAIRETFEELGISRGKIKIIGRMDTLVAPMGAAIDPVVALVDLKSLDELVINHREVESAFLLPLSFFQNSREDYKVRLEVQPSYKGNGGKEVLLLPSEELGLPEKYLKPWGDRFYRIFVYRTEYGPIWGVTAELVNEVVEKWFK